MSENSDELEALPRASTSKSDKSSSYRQKKSKNECKENVDLICIKKEPNEEQFQEGSSSKRSLRSRSVKYEPDIDVKLDRKSIDSKRASNRVKQQNSKRFWSSDDDESADDNDDDDFKLSNDEKDESMDDDENFEDSNSEESNDEVKKNFQHPTTLKTIVKSKSSESISSDNSLKSQEVKSEECQTFNESNLFNCTICGANRSSVTRLRQHILITHLKITDPKERKRFFNVLRNRKLRMDKKIQYRNTNFQCEICGAVSASHRASKHHRKKHFQDQQFQCDICGYYSTTKKPMEDHMNDHLGTFSHMCNICGYSTNNIKHLNYHLKVHSKPPVVGLDSSLRCRICRKKYFSQEDYEMHACSSQRNTIRTVDTYCIACNEHFMNIQEKNTHDCPYKHPTDPSIIICRVCHRELPQRILLSHMNSHKEVNCSLYTKTKCEICSESFDTKAKYLVHMRYHGKQTEEVFQCKYCPKKFMQKAQFVGHVERIHENIKRCEICKEPCIGRDELKAHLEASHPQKYCRFCGRGFSLPRYLKAHEQTHLKDTTGKVPCQFCSKMFVPKNYKHHIYKFHKENFPMWLAANPNIV